LSSASFIVAGAYRNLVKGLENSDILGTAPMPGMKKKCVGCGKLIPSGALDCVFCRARQPSETAQELLVEGERRSLHATDETLVNFTLKDLEAKARAAGGDAAPAAASAAATAPASEAAAPANGSAPAFPSATKVTAMMQAVVIADETPLPTPSPMLTPAPAPAPAAADAEVDIDVVAPRRRERARAETPDRPFDRLGRNVMGIGGAVLVALFFMPWHGVTSWRLLDTLAGADFVRQLFYLMGGVVLLATAALPVPFAFRAAIGAAVAALPVVLGCSGVLDGWRGVVAGLAILALPATHFLRAQAKSQRAARVLVGGAVAAVAILYFAPASSVVPIAQVFRMIGSGQLILAVIGLFVLIPLVFAGLSLVGLMGRDLTDVGVLISVLCLLWAPVVVALRGFMLEDGTQLYVALALLAASATSAVSLAQLLSLMARDRAAA
jgi:hypothetical protein